MVIDTSALLAVLWGEPEAERFVSLLAAARDPLMSTATLLEASMVIYARTGDKGIRRLDELLAAAGIRPVAVDVAQAHLARNAFVRFGKGQAPAGLNFGDCFSYALAKSMERPLLFKGDDFSQTDVIIAA